MASRNYEVSFRISGALNGTFAAAMRAAQAAMNQLSDAAKKVNSAMASSQGQLSGYLQRIQKIADNVQAYKNAMRDVPKTQEAIRSQIVENSRLAQTHMQNQRALAQARQAQDRLKTAMSDSAKAVRDAQNKSKEYKRTLDNAKGALRQLEQQHGKTSAEYRAGKAALDQAQAAYDAQKAKVQQLQTEYKNLRSSYRNSGNELKSLEQATNQSGNAFRESQNKLKTLYQDLERQRSRLAELKSSLSNAGVNVSSLGSAESRLRSEIESTTAAIERQRQAMQNLSTAQANVDRASQQFSDAQNAFNTAVDAAKTIASPFVKSAETAISFEAEMSRVKALTQAQNIREGKMDVVNREFAKLENQARELGATTQFTAVQAAQAMSYLGMAGWKTKQIFDTMPGMLNLASAAGAELASVADIVSDNMQAMGVPVEKAPHFMDVYAYALTNSNAKLTDFGETMKYAAPVAKAFGSSLDETAAMVMMMANAGIKGSMAGTSLRMGLLRLAGPPKTATKAMKELGLSLSDAQAGALEAEAVIKGLGIDLTGAATPGEKMTRVLMQLHEKTKDLSQDEKLAAFKGIFGVNAETGWLALFDQGPEVFLKYVEGLRNADGYSKQVAGTMLDNTQGAITILKSAVEGAEEAVGSALTPAIRTAAESVTPLISRFTLWAQQNPRIIQGVVGIIAVLTGLAVAVTGVALAFASWSVITTQFAMFRAGIAAVRSGMIATEIAALGMSASMGAAFSTIRTTLAGASLGAAFTSIGTAIRVATTAAWGFITTPIGAALAALAVAAYLVYSNWDRLAPVFKNVADTFLNSLSAIEPAISAAVAAIKGAFKSLGDTGIGDTLIKGIIVIVNVAASVAATLINIFAQAVITIADLFKNLGDVVSNVLKGDFVEAGKSAANLMTDAVTDVVNTVTALKTLGDMPANTQKSLKIFDEQTKLKARGTVSERVAASVAQSPTASEKIQATLDGGAKAAEYQRQIEIAQYGAQQSVQRRQAQARQATADKIFNSVLNHQPIQQPQSVQQSQPVQQVQQTQPVQPVQQVQPQISPQYQRQLQQIDIDRAKIAERNYLQLSEQTHNLKLQDLQNYNQNQQAYQNLLQQQQKNWQIQQPQPVQQVQPQPKPIQPVQQQTPTPSATSQPTPQATPQTKPAEQSKPVDTQALQTNLNAASQSANQLSQAQQQAVQAQNQAAQAQSQIPQATQNVQSALQTLPQSVQPVQAAVGQLGTVATTASSVVGQLGTAATTASAMVGQLGTVSASSANSVGQLGTVSMSTASAVGQLGTAAQMAAAAVGQLGTAAAGAASGVGQLGTASSGAASSVGFLGSAASAAASALSAAASSIASAAASAASAAASASAAAASAGKPAANYKGGIYNKGAFLTWFAEKSPEAAIPLDKSQRAINLWTQAGQILGVLPNESNSVLTTDKPSADSTRRGILNFERAKEYRAKQIYNSILNQQNSQIHNTISTQDSAITKMTSTISKISNVQSSVQNLQAAQFDELGNIIGLNGAAGNVITKYDNDKIKQVKQAAQLHELSAGKTSTRNSDRLFQIALERFKKLKAPSSTPTENLPASIILTEQQRFRSEDVTKEKTLERVANSRSYKAIQNAMKVSNRTSNSTTNSTSILNQGELKTTIPTDLTGGLFSRLGLGNINLGGIMGVDLGNILGGIFGKPDVTQVDITNPVPTFPRQQKNQPPIIDSPILTTLSKTNSIVERVPQTPANQIPAQNSTSILNKGELKTTIPTDLTGGLFGRLGLGNINLNGIMGVDLGNILDGVFDFDFKNIFGGQTQKNSPAEKIMNLSNTFSSMTQSVVTPINSALSSPLSIEPLESVQPAESSGNFATTFQPTFNIEVKVSLSGSDVNAREVGQQIATFTRQSFEKEFAEFMHEKSRRGYA